MKALDWSRILFAATPLAGLILLSVLYIFSVRAYYRCEFPGIACEPINSSLDQILGPYSHDMDKPLPDDKEDIKTAKREQAALKSSGRLNFVFFAMLYFLVCVIACSVGLSVLYRALEEVTQHQWKFMLLGLALMLAFGVLLYFNPWPYMSLFAKLFEGRVRTEVTGVDGLMRLVNSFGFAICLLITLAVSTLLFAPRDASNPEGLKKLAQRMKYLRLILYVGTTMLIVGVLFIRSIYQWSLSFMVRDAAGLKIAEGFFANELAIEGGFFTLVLAVVYLPAALILRYQADSVSGLPDAESEREEKLKEYNLAFSFTQSLPRIAAILGPVLVGPIGELVGRLS
jgi:hypothetical protein